LNSATYAAGKKISEHDRTFLLDILDSPSADRSDNEGEDGIMDLLGIYDSDKQTVVLYTRAIDLCSRAKGIPYGDLYTIVLCHELAHAANHMGVDNGNQTWSRFSQALSEEKEFFAQIYTHHYFKQIGESDRVKIMSDLTQSQPPKYGEYLLHLNKSVEEINNRLMKARLA